MNTERFIAARIIKGGESQQFSRPVTKIAVLGIALGLGVMILTVAVVTGFQKEIRNKLIGFGAHIQVTYYDANISDEPRPIERYQPFLKDLRNDPEIKHIQEFATKNGIIKTKTDNEGIVLKGIGKDFDWTFLKQNMKEGKPFTVTDTGLSKSIVISRALANKLELKLNEKMIIYFLTKRTDSMGVRYEQRVKTFYISGIYETGFEDIDSKMAVIDINQIRRLNYWSDSLTGGFEIAIKNYSQIEKEGARVYDAVGQGLIAQTIKETHPTVFSWLDLQDINAVIVIVLMLLVAGINMISALLILILERTSMIGILKALGAANISIQKIFIYNAVYLVTRGMIWGNILGIGIALFQKYTGFFSLDQATYYVSVIPMELKLWHLLLLNAGTLAACVLMLLLPSFIVSKITPVKAIRFR